MGVIVELRYNKTNKEKSLHCPVCGNKLSNRAHQPTCPDGCVLPLQSEPIHAEKVMTAMCEASITKAEQANLPVNLILGTIRTHFLFENPHQTRQLLALCDIVLPDTKSKVLALQLIESDSLLTTALIRAAHGY